MTDTKTLIEWADKHLMYTAKRAPVALVRGEGVRVWDSDGKEYLDFTAGIAVTALGHSHPKVVGTMREQAATLLHVSNLFYIPQQTQLAKLLCDHSFADRVFFSNSGAEANESAIKLARKWAKEHGASDRGDIITMRGGFHGRTLATVTATAQEKYHHGFEPLPGGFKYVPFNDLRAVERAIDSHTAAVMVEPIQGEGGINIPDDGYLPGLRKLCDEAGILLVLDEIQTGMGRTGRLWGYEHSGIEPDIMTLAKALANGVPIGATLATVTATAQEKYHHGFEPLPGGFKYVPFNDLRAVERAIDSHTAAVMVEPIQGEGGINIPDDGYLPGLRKLCDEAGVLLVLDEIQTGMGRTGRLWGYEHSGIEPDIMTLAKALANGVPIGATLATESVASAFTPGTHGSTFGGNPFATAVGVTVFATLMEERLPERAAAMGRVLREHLEALRARHPKAATAVRGRGLLVGMDLVPPVGDVITACRERGLLALSAGDNTLRLAPPLVVDEAAIRHGVEIIDQALAGFGR